MDDPVAPERFTHLFNKGKIPSSFPGGDTPVWLCHEWHLEYRSAESNMQSYLLWQVLVKKGAAKSSSLNTYNPVKIFSLIKAMSTSQENSQTK